MQYMLWIFFHFHLNSIYILFFSIQAYILIFGFSFLFRVSRFNMCYNIYCYSFNTIMLLFSFLWSGNICSLSRHFSRKRASLYKSLVLAILFQL